MRQLVIAGMLAVSTCSWAAGRVELPRPDLTALEPSVAEQLSELREFAGTVVHNALASEIDKTKAWGEMGQLYHAYGLHEAAEVCYEQAETRDYGNPAWPYYRGHVALAQGDLESAAARFNRSLELRPEDGATLVFLADVESARGRKAEAKALLERAAQAPSAEPVVWARLGELALAEERYDRAVELLSAVLEAVPQATRLRHPLGLAYRGLGDIESARTHLAQRGDIGLAPSDPLMEELENLQVGERVHLLRGRSAYNAGSMAEAAAEFQLAVDAQPESVRARVNLSAALAAVGDGEGALRELQHAVALDPGNATARFNLASLLASAGEHRLAIVHFAAAVSSQPRDEEAWLGEARSWIALGDFARATARLSLANATFPESGLIAYGLARLMAAGPDLTLRDGERALDLASRVFEAKRTPANATLVSLALRELGRCDEARTWFDGLIEEAEATDAVEERALLAERRAELGDADPCRP